MCLPKCDDDGHEIPNEYGFVTVGSIWERDDRGSIIGGDVHLDSLNDNSNFGWLEITFKDLEENFILIQESCGRIENSYEMEDKANIE